MPCALAERLSIQATQWTSHSFLPKGKLLKLYGEDIQVFEYANASRAAKEAESVNPSGASAGTSMINWVAPPHFYRSGKIIVLYVGENPNVTQTLISVLGSQFAGK